MAAALFFSSSSIPNHIANAIHVSRLTLVGGGTGRLALDGLNLLALPSPIPRAGQACNDKTGIK